MVVSVEAPTGSPCGSTAVTCTSESTCDAATLTSSVRSDAADAATCQTWRPSGRATCDPGILESPDPAEMFAVSQYGLRSNRVRGISAKSPLPNNDPTSTA